MDKIIKLALDSFEHNRKMAEQAVKERSVELSGHKHGLFCFKWRACRKMEKAIAETQQRIEGYKEAEEGIRAGNFAKAIEMLGEIAGQLEETPMQIARRVASSPPPTLESILNSPTGLAHRMKQVRDYLVSLQHNSVHA